MPPYTIRCQSGPLTKFTLRRFCRWECGLKILWIFNQTEQNTSKTQRTQKAPVFSPKTSSFHFSFLVMSRIPNFRRRFRNKVTTQRVTLFLSRMLCATYIPSIKDTLFCLESNGEHAGESSMWLRFIVFEIASSTFAKSVDFVKIWLWLLITQSHIDLGSQKAPPIASNHREKTDAPPPSARLRYEKGRARARVIKREFIFSKGQ